VGHRCRGNRFHRCCIPHEDVTTWILDHIVNPMVAAEGTLRKHRLECRTRNAGLDANATEAPPAATCSVIEATLLFCKS
jgi:hypothetical protein